MAEQIFILAHRELNGEVYIETEKDFITAVAKQKALLVGLTDVNFQKSILTKEELEEIARELKLNNRCRMCNDEEEVVLFYLPKRETMR